VRVRLFQRDALPLETDIAEGEEEEEEEVIEEVC
jgi:hypothetical protein